MSQAYGEAWYWDKRYAKESTASFDWYQKYESLAQLLHLYVPIPVPIPITTTHRCILVVGCGNSAFSEGMSKDGYTDIVNIDISSVVIEEMQKKYSGSSHGHLKYIEMDVRYMKAFEVGSFDAVIDKGTLDSLLCGHNSKENAGKMLQEIERVLKKEGVYIMITYGIPAYRLCLLIESHSWAIKLHVIDKVHPWESSKAETWELTRPVPLNSDRSLREGKRLENMDVHYIYVCTKVSCYFPFVLLSTRFHFI